MTLPPLRPSDPPEIEHVLWEGMEGELAFDIGARKGENFEFLKGLGYKGIIACEPQPDSYAEMRERFLDWTSLDHAPWLFLSNTAVSDHEGVVELAEVPMAISKGEWVTPGTDGMEWSLQDWDSAQIHRVPCVTLDQLAEDSGTPDLVVIDTEGHEAQILRGARDVLAQGKTKWLIEFHAPGLRADCESLLLHAGLEVETVRHPHYAHGSHMWQQHGWLRALPRRKNVST